MWILIVFACAILPGFAQPVEAVESNKARCKPYLDSPLPPEAKDFSIPGKWPDCNSYKLYSGIGVKIDYTAARKCAWSERLAQQTGIETKDSIADVFGGSAMLAVLYANGEGTAQNIALAERFVCEAGGAPAEVHIRFDHVATLNKNHPPQTKFGFCDDITSGFMQGFCAAYGSELQEQKRAKALNQIASRLPIGQQKLFNSLRTAQEVYARAHARGEIDLSGTARAMFQIDAEDTLRENFIEAVRSFEAGKFPSGSSADYADADNKLNAAYRNAINNSESSKDDYGAVQPEGIRNVERAWLRYRDAFVAFAKLRYPGIPAEAWLTLLTKDRTSILDGSFCGMDAVEPPCTLSGDTWKPSPLP